MITLKKVHHLEINVNRSTEQLDKFILLFQQTIKKFDHKINLKCLITRKFVFVYIYSMYQRSIFIAIKIF